MGAAVMGAASSRAAVRTRAAQARVVGVGDQYVPLSRHLPLRARDAVPAVLGHIATRPGGLGTVDRPHRALHLPISDRVEGFLVQLGGHVGGDYYRFGKKVSWPRMQAQDLPDFIERLVRSWLDDRDEGEEFSSWVHRQPEADLQALVLAAAATKAR